MSNQSRLSLVKPAVREPMLARMMLSGPTGSGKGLPLDTSMLTPSGWITMADVEVGTELIGVDGEPTPVTRVYDRGEQDLYRVTFDDGAEIICDGDHLWSVQTRKMARTSGNWEVRATAELAPQAAECYARNEPWRIPLVAPVQHDKIELPIEPYLLGVILANGGLSSYRCVLSTNDEEIIASIIDRNPGLDISEASVPGYCRRWAVRGIQPVLRALGLFGKLSAEKFIPAPYLTADEMSRRALLAGLVDCDGSAMAGNRRPRYFSTSPALADGVVALVRSLGGTTRVDLDDRPRQAPCYSVSIMGLNPFTLQRKAKPARPAWRAITAIVPCGRGITRCIKVDAPDELFVVSDYIVTHNTRTGLIVATELAEGGKVLGIDTEKGSMRTYADDFSFLHLPWDPPFDPRELTQTLHDAADDYAVIFVDSASHFWRKEGGTLDIAGGRFTGWKDARPIQEALVEAILNCKAHVILGCRSKMERVQEKEGDRYVVHELGMADQQDDDLAYELNVAMLLEKPSHTATVTKSRTIALPVGRSYDVSKTSDMARVYRDWLKAGDRPASEDAINGIRARVAALPPELAQECQDQFVAELCKPKYLRESQLDAAMVLITRFEVQVNPSAMGDGTYEFDVDPDDGRPFEDVEGNEAEARGEAALEDQGSML